MVSKSGAAPPICGAPAVSQTGTHPTVASNVNAMKRRPSNAQMAATIVAVAGQQQQLLSDQRYAIGAPHHMMNPGQIPMQMQMMQPMASSPSAGNLSLEHNARAQLFHGRAGIAKTGENGPGRLVNGHDQSSFQTGVPNGARRSQPQPNDAAEEERIAELVVAQGESQKAAAAEQKAKLPRKNRRKTDLSKEASPRDDEEPFIVDGSRRRAPGVATSHVQAAASNFQATMARQQQMMKQQQVQPKQ
ncbi:hypothetical protein NECAME_03456 [Necator americanus]|uniref:Uncharacterized protein n=1 Tax=Necator americanus TaxID=51031 RepID=W2T4M0_NECAM|nr:hypothetical protein NECAME_03456 [Necator americanus]ETN76524.1 hypothetical protein NECAME_03456 [Necator americanus]